MCSNDINDIDKALVRSIIDKLPAFYFLGEKAERDMRLALLETKELVRFDDSTCYAGEWRCGTGIREGRGC